MRKPATKRKQACKPNSAAKATRNAILADLTEFAEALEGGVALDTKYTIRRVHQHVNVCRTTRELAKDIHP